MADILDILTLAEAQARLSTGSANTTSNTKLVSFITSVSRLIDRKVGPVVQRTVNETLTGDGAILWVNYYPVAAISSLVEYQGTTAVTLTLETQTSKPGTGYLTVPYRNDPTLFSGRIRRRSGGWDYPFYRWGGGNNIVIAYTAGRYASTTSVDARFKEAAGIMLENLWRSQQNSLAQVNEYDVPMQSFPTFAVPNAVRQLLEDEWQDNIGALVG